MNVLEALKKCEEGIPVRRRSWAETGIDKNWWLIIRNDIFTF